MVYGTVQNNEECSPRPSDWVRAPGNAQEHVDGLGTWNRLAVYECLDGIVGVDCSYRRSGGLRDMVAATEECD